MSETNNQVATGTSNAATNAQPQQQQQPEANRQTIFGFIKSLLVRAAIIYFITTLFRSSTNRNKPNLSDVSNGASSKIAARNIFIDGSFMDFYAYISESEDFSDFKNKDALFWMKRNIQYGDWKSGKNQDGIHSVSKVFRASENLKNNGSIYLHVYVTAAGKTPDPLDGKELYAGDRMSYSRKMLNKFKKKHFSKTKNLLTGQTEQPPEDIIKAETMTEEIISHWHPNITVNLVIDQTNWVRGSVPPPIDEYVDFSVAGDKYKPILFINDFWNLYRDYQPINSTTEELELQITYQPLTLFKWQLYAAQNMRNKWTSNLFGETLSQNDDEDQDTMKEALLETSPYLLALTAAVTILHSLFELLAFKNDIQFWNNRKSLEGLSVRSVFFNVFQSLIVLLYVLDNETNTIIRISCFVGLCIEVWKINKVVDVKFDSQNKIFGILPRFSFEDKGSYIESSTREYDTMAFKYLSWLCFPLLGGYAVYSLIYQEHKGWYSFVLNMLYGFLLTFGFITMTPQLFINYKLKSVAHLPWRMMTYKFLNTFIDDIFAFLIKMPTMYRLGCFRDDIVFFIFLYQRWIYKVDATRVNEFGFSQEMEEQAKRSGSEQANGQPPAIENVQLEEDKKNQ